LFALFGSWSLLSTRQNFVLDVNFATSIDLSRDEIGKHLRSYRYEVHKAERGWGDADEVSYDNWFENYSFRKLYAVIVYQPNGKVERVIFVSTISAL